MNLNNKEHILYFCPSPIYGGVERFIETSVDELLLEQELKVSLFFLHHGRFFEKAQSKKYAAYLSPFKVRLRNPFSWLFFQFYFFYFLKKHKVTRVQLSMPYSQVFGSLPARLSGAKIEWFQHGPIGGPLDKLANYFPCDEILFNSEYTKSEHLEKVGKLKTISSIHKMPVKTNFDGDCVSTIQMTYKGEGLLFISTGRITRWKGFETTIKALSLVDQAGLSNFRLLIIGEATGEDGLLYLKELRDIATKSSIKKKINFLSFKENLYDYIKASDALIHSAIRPEPYGLVVAESINLDTYVFAPDIGGVKEQLLLAQSKGSLFDHQNAEISLSQKILSKYLKL